MKVGIEMNIDEVVGKLNDVARRQVPFAAAMALNETAKKINAAEIAEMRDVFSNPTPYTLRGTFYTRANKNKLEVIIGLKDFSAKAIPAAKFLAPQVEGGSRRLKRFEVALRAAGVLPSGYFAVPGEGAKRDAWGNMNRGQLVQVLSYFKSFPETGYKANMIDKRKASLARGGRKNRGFSYFVVRPGDQANRRAGLPPGVWQRVRFGIGTALKPILIFVTRAHYDAIFDFEYVAELTAKQQLSPQFSRAFAAAMRTAR